LSGDDGERYGATSFGTIMPFSWRMIRMWERIPPWKGSPAACGYGGMQVC